jgi:hypothetical protein
MDQEGKMERSVLPPLDSSRPTRAKSLITTSSGPDGSQDGEFSHSRPTARTGGEKQQL